MQQQPQLQSQSQQRPLPASPSPPPPLLHHSSVPSAAHHDHAAAPEAVPAADVAHAYPILRHGVMQSVSVGAAPRGGGGGGFTAAASPSHAQAVAAATKAAEAAATQPSAPVAPLPALRWSRSAVQLLSCGSRRSPGGSLIDADLNGALEFASMKGATLTAVTSAAAVRLQQMPQAAAAGAAVDDADPSQGNTRLFLVRSTHKQRRLFQAFSDGSHSVAHVRYVALWCHGYLSNAFSCIRLLRSAGN